MEKTLLKKIENHCKKYYPPHNWQGHLIPVVNIADKLAKQYEVDKQIVKAGAYLHDIGRVKYSPILQRIMNHEMIGYIHTKKYLKKQNCSNGDIDKIAYCVKIHSGTGEKGFIPKTIEAEIVMNADALAHFEKYIYLFSIYYSNHGENLEQTKSWVLNKLQKSKDTKITLKGLKPQVEELYLHIEQELNEYS